jgi:hypothetical protein
MEEAKFGALASGLKSKSDHDNRRKAKDENRRKIKE